MKNRFYISIVILVCLCKFLLTDSNSEISNINTQDISSVIKSGSISNRLLTSSSNIEPSKDVILSGFNFTIVLNEQGDTTHWSTSDRNFKTPEGYSTGTNWENLPKELQKAIEREPGWGYYIRLNSKWQLGFCEGESCTNTEPKKGSNVKWIFKRKN